MEQQTDNQFDGIGDELVDEGNNETSNEQPKPRPKRAWAGIDPSNEESEIETVKVKEGMCVSFQCVEDPTKIEEEVGGVTFKYAIKNEFKKGFMVDWKFQPKNANIEGKGREIMTIKDASCLDQGDITAEICKISKRRRKDIIETKTWRLCVEGKTEGSSDVSHISTAGPSETKDNATETDTTAVIPGSPDVSHIPTTDPSEVTKDNATETDRWDVHKPDKEKWKGVDYQDNDWIDCAIKSMRYFLHGLIFLIVTTCFVMSKGSLQILLSLLGNENIQTTEMTDTKSMLTWFLCFILTLPDGMTMLFYILRFLIGKHGHKGEMPKERNSDDAEEELSQRKQKIIFTVTELLSCIGINGWIFFVCPYLSSVEICLVPVVFVWTSAFRYQRIPQNDQKVKLLYFFTVPIMIVSILAILGSMIYFKHGQISTLTITFMWISALFVPMRWLRNYAYIYKDDIIHNYSLLRLIVAVARCFISFLMFVCYMFLDRSVTSIPSPFQYLFPVKDNSALLFNWTSIYTSGCTSGIYEYMIPTNPVNKSLHYFIFELFLTHLIATYLLYYFAVLACRICMQKICFAAALVIAGFFLYPISLLIFNISMKNSFGCHLDIHEQILFGLFFGLCLLQFWTLFHISEKQQKIMPFDRRLFNLPHYCSLIPDLSLLHSRKVLDNKDNSENKENTDSTKSSSSDTTLTNQTSQSSQPASNNPEPNVDNSESQTNSTTVQISNEQEENVNQTNSSPACNNQKSSGQKSPNSETKNASSTSTESQSTQERNDKEHSITKLFICATMWHETLEEMKSLIFSILRLDYDHALTRNSTFVHEYEPEERELFEFEGHIFFDDAFKNDQGERKVVNNFVGQLRTALEQAVRKFYNSDVKLEQPKDFYTVYGKRLEWKLPGQNSLFIHLTDKDKIRIKKRWSQVMYFYYLLGFKLTQNNNDEEISKKNENTYILALDGDVIFYPDAIKRLVARMQKNPSVAASSGRIVPSGSGPVVWYQQFEYAVGHWLQKTTEHVFGCVLCSPGCFTLFRAKSLLSGNILRNYTKVATKPREVVQYDQGEDRWLCTLLLKEGFRVEYFAAAQANTSVPEEFDVLFNQRKRWIPSTIANIIDILQNSREIRKNNQNISLLYVIYQGILFMATILGPSTILLAMDAALQVVFGLQPWQVYVFIYGPPVIYIFICLKFNSSLQRNIGVILSLAYSLLMLSVFIGTVANIVKEGWYTPSAVFLYVLFGVFILAGLMHISEICNLIHIFIYFIFLPLGFLFIPIYAICNMNNASWGTRDNQKPECSNIDENENTDSELKKTYGNLIRDINKFLLENNKISSSKYNILKLFNISYYLLQLKLFEIVETHLKTQNSPSKPKPKGKISSPNDSKDGQDKHNTKDEDNQKGREEYQNEESFWEKLKEKYLSPTDKGCENAEDLERFRNRMASMFFFFNAVWMVIVSSMNQVKQDLNISLNIAGGHPILIEPLGFAFLIIFALLLFIQVIGMILHRYSTFLHVIAATDLRNEKFYTNLSIRKNVEELISPSENQTELPQENNKRSQYTEKDLKKAVETYQSNQKKSIPTSQKKSSWSCCSRRNKVGNLKNEENKRKTGAENKAAGSSIRTEESNSRTNADNDVSVSSEKNKCLNLIDIFHKRMNKKMNGEFKSICLSDKELICPLK